MPTSPNDTVTTGIGASVTDASGSIWTIDSSGQITVNGEIDTTTANVDELAYDNGIVWQKNAANNWYSKSSPSASWVQWTAASAPVPIPNVSVNDATVAAGSAGHVVDSNGNVWSLTKSASGEGYQVTVDGSVDPTTSNVVQLAIVNGTVWQENTVGLWYSKTSPAAVWSSATAIDPITKTVEPVSLTWVGGGNNLATNPADWSPAVAPAAGDALTMGSGTINVSGNALAGDTLTIAPEATVTIDTIGTTALSLRTYAPGDTINLSVGNTGKLILNAVIGGANLNSSGGTISFIGTSVFGSFDTVLSNNIVGSGTLDLDGGNASGEAMTINGSVGSGLTFNIDAGPIGDAGLQIDRPASFNAAVDLQGAGYLTFMGLQATSGDLLNGVLELFNGTKVIDSTRVTDTAISAYGALQLQQNSLGVSLSIGLGQYDQPGGVGTALPLHT